MRICTKKPAGLGRVDRVGTVDSRNAFRVRDLGCYAENEERGIEPRPRLFDPSLEKAFRAESVPFLHEGKASGVLVVLVNFASGFDVLAEKRKARSRIGFRLAELNRKAKAFRDCVLKSGGVVGSELDRLHAVIIRIA
jgi:hypothetical protein